jgi:hypothetical protein
MGDWRLVIGDWLVIEGLVIGDLLAIAVVRAAPQSPITNRQSPTNHQSKIQHH